MKNLSKFSLVGVFYFISLTLFAVPAIPYPVTITQTDGTQLTVILRGDENAHFQTTADGYPIIKSQKGIYNYAVLDDSGNFSDSQVKASNIDKRTDYEKKFLNTIPKNISFPLAKISGQNKVKSISSKIIKNPAKFPLTGSPRSLVILVNFSDKSFVVSSPQTAYTNLLNQVGYSTNGGTGSAKDYFKDNSMGVFNPQFDVVGPYTLSQPYSYYGKNDTNGSDQNPVQMIVDACTAASKSGVDFSVYDTDNDGYVDNIFVYYAGYNEAEWGPSDTVWPHRWGIYPGYNYSGTVASITFNGKKIMDYACTSELKGSSGSNMCGIGTFCHEFGHVLGLVDFYATNGATHQTLSYWDIMDAGPYLNSGRTPPSYSSHERFYLGWLTPTELKTAQDVTLDPLNTSNKAYIVTQGGNSNLNGSNPSPSEYFMFENRQKTGWDAYLPGHGLLVTRVNYSLSDWNNNSPNNNANSMDVDIMEADNIASDQTLAGDTYPGTSNVTNYTPILLSGTIVPKPLTFIQESNNIINFRFMGGSNAPKITTSSNFTQFSTVQTTPSATQMVTVSGKKLVGDIIITFGVGTHFEIKKESDPATSWGKSVTLTKTDSVVPSTNILVRYNPTVPSYKQTHTDLLVFSSSSAESVRTSIEGKSSRPVFVKPPVALNAKDITYRSFVAQWNDTTKDAKGYYLSVYYLKDGKNIYLKDSVWTTLTSDTLYNLVSDKDYYYVVRESDKNTLYGYENITGKSNEIKVHTLSYTSDKDLRVTVDQTNGNVLVFVPKIGSVVNVFNSLGQKIMSFTAESDIVNLNTLPKNHVYIIQSEKLRTKIIW